MKKAFIAFLLGIVCPMLLTAQNEPSLHQRGVTPLANPQTGMNTSFGINNLLRLTTGWGNSAFGYSALNSNTVGTGNSAFGPWALRLNSTGSSNTANGYAALENNTGGSRNTVTGVNAMRANLLGSDNTATGLQALISNTTGNSNTATGLQSMNSSTTGNFNTAFGTNALFNNITGSFNTAIGSGADVTGSALSNATAIGFNAKVSASDALVLGNNVVKIGIHTASPTSVFHVVCNASTNNSGGIRFENLPTGKGNLLVIDAFGNVFQSSIPALIQAATATQQATIDQQKEEIESLKGQITQINQRLGIAAPNTQSRLSNSESNLEPVSVYPNPTTGRANFQYHLATSVKNAAIVVTDLQGKFIQKLTLSNNKGVAEIDFQNKGLFNYTLIVDGNIKTTKQIFVEK